MGYMAIVAWDSRYGMGFWVHLSVLFIRKVYHTKSPRSICHDISITQSPILLTKLARDGNALPSSAIPRIRDPYDIDCNGQGLEQSTSVPQH
jgi:hypothetical protein